MEQANNFNVKWRNTEAIAGKFAWEQFCNDFVPKTKFTRFNISAFLKRIMKSARLIFPCNIKHGSNEITLFLFLPHISYCGVCSGLALV